MQSGLANLKKVSKCPSLLKSLNIWMSQDSNFLRQNGYTPDVLHQSGEQCLLDHKYMRAKLLYRTLLQQEIFPEEAAIYQKSGDALDQHGFKNKAMRHWAKAFKHGHRPYEMNMSLGHGLLVNGQLPQAEKIFQFQTSTFPQDPISHNELGVTYFMQALQQKDSNIFIAFQNNALKSFRESLKHKPDAATVLENQKVVSVLTPLPVYGKPHRDLKPKSGLMTCMLDPIMKGLKENEYETKSEATIAMGFSTGAKGDLKISPTLIPYGYKVSRSANFFAQDALLKIKREQMMKQSEELSLLKPN